MLVLIQQRNKSFIINGTSNKACASHCLGLHCLARKLADSSIEKGLWPSFSTLAASHQYLLPFCRPAYFLTCFQRPSTKIQLISSFWYCLQKNGLLSPWNCFPCSWNQRKPAYRYWKDYHQYNSIIEREQRISPSYDSWQVRERRSCCQKGIPLKRLERMGCALWRNLHNRKRQRYSL